MVDYGLARRATLASVRSGHTTVADVCDAHPYLLRAAKFHGEPTEALCPICRKAKLTHVTYVYGDELGQYEGRVKQARELAEMAAEYGEFRVYVVEVCQSCGWNHLATSYALGTGEPAVRRRRRARTSQYTTRAVGKTGCAGRPDRACASGRAAAVSNLTGFFA